MTYHLICRFEQNLYCIQSKFQILGASCNLQLLAVKMLLVNTGVVGSNLTEGIKYIHIFIHLNCSILVLVNKASVGGVRRSPTQVFTRVTCDQRSPTQVLTRVTRGQHAEK